MGIYAKDNSMIAVDSDEKVDLQNTELYWKASRSSLTENNSVKCMLFVTTCCIYKSTSCIYLLNNCKEKCTFSTRPQVLRDQISQEILIGSVIFLCLSKIYLSGFTQSKLHFKSQDETVSIRS